MSEQIQSLFLIIHFLVFN